ncbi:hypothetical protein SLS61_004310 [Didymella pomorum]
MSSHVDLILTNGSIPENVDSGDDDAWVDLKSANASGGYQSVGLSYLFPRAYSLPELVWRQIAVGNEDLFAN